MVFAEISSDFLVKIIMMKKEEGRKWGKKTNEGNLKHYKKVLKVQENHDPNINKLKWDQFYSIDGL
jgi:hypothetical protein